ncbi:MAG: hypothetical protein K5987_02410 [Lachnospiraceae bacterium]|nr:hypothetical protein [Lachnospiraceae bacterium]
MKIIKKIYLCYVILLLALTGFLLLYTRKSLIMYEYAQPEKRVNQLITAMKNGLTDTLEAQAVTHDDNIILPGFSVSVDNITECNRFENPESFIEEISAGLKDGAVVTYRNTGEDYDTGAMNYALYLGTEHFADLDLLPGDSSIRLLFLKMTEWQPEKLILKKEGSRHSVHIEMPADHSAAINGVLLTEEYLSSLTELPELEYCRRYTDIPGLKSYDIEGFLSDEDVNIYDAYGNLCDAQISSERSYRVGYEKENMPTELKKTVLDMAETYSLFFTRDLPGATVSIDPIRKLFPEDSEYLSLAETYRRHDMEIIVAHSGTAFKDEKISDYTRYGSGCFSCRISFVKTMNMYGTELEDVTDSVYYFVNIDGEWKIADIE